jgi:pyrroloquinoline quinone (PQQ) biosynthesis protein C
MQREKIEYVYQQLARNFRHSPQYRALVTGRLSDVQIDKFLCNLYRTHVRSPRLLAFLYAIAPSGPSSDSLLHNLLEELGRDEEAGHSHPELLEILLAGAGLSIEARKLQQEADDELERYVVDPLLYGTLHELGLAVLVEVVAFEYVLSQCAGEIGQSLEQQRHMTKDKVVWLSHHGIVDIAHAQEGIDNILRFMNAYSINDERAETIIQMALREDIFSKRYFRDIFGEGG